MRSLAALVLGLALVSCGKQEPVDTAPAGPAQPVAPAPVPQPAAGGGATADVAQGSPVAIPVAERTVCEHLDLLRAQSPFRRPGAAEPRVAGPAGERRISWGASGTFWEALLDLCAKAGLYIEDVRDSVWLGTGPERRHGLTAAGPALLAVTGVKDQGDKLRFLLWVAFEPPVAPDAGLLNVPRLTATLGGDALRPLSTNLNENRCEWPFEVPRAATAAGPLEVAIELQKAAGFAHVEIDPVAGATRSGPGGAWSLTVKQVGANAITTTEKGLKVADRFLLLPDEKQVPSSGGQGAMADGDYTADFRDGFPPGAAYVLKVQTTARTVRCRGRIGKPDWDAWREGK